jgi:RNA polymerase sigma factor
MDISRIAAEDEARSEFIGQHREFIRRAASLHCGRPLTWGRDEELSIAMLAFDTALSSYSAERGAKFETFATLVIKRRLIDYQRRQARNQETPVAEIPSGALGRDQVFDRLERAWELEEFEHMVGAYSISFKHLKNESPRHKRVRERLLEAVTNIIGKPQLHKAILESGRLPLEELCQLTGETRKALAKRRRYLLAALLVAARKEEFPFIASYLGIKR